MSIHLIRRHFHRVLRRLVKDGMRVPMRSRQRPSAMREFRRRRHDKGRRGHFGVGFGDKVSTEERRMMVVVLVMVLVMIGYERLKVSQREEIMMAVETRVEGVLEGRSDRVIGDGGSGDGGNDGENQRRVEQSRRRVRIGFRWRGGPNARPGSGKWGEGKAVGFI